MPKSSGGWDVVTGEGRTIDTILVIVGVGGIMGDIPSSSVERADVVA